MYMNLGRVFEIGKFESYKNYSYELIDFGNSDVSYSRLSLDLFSIFI